MNNTYIAKALKVQASKIVGIHYDHGDTELPNPTTKLLVELESGELVNVTGEMLARVHNPVIGHYVVTEDDGYRYLCACDVFERKYQPFVEPPVPAEEPAAQG